jgi:hypothetical protein
VELVFAVGWAEAPRLECSGCRLAKEASATAASRTAASPFQRVDCDDFRLIRVTGERAIRRATETIPSTTW